MVKHIMIKTWINIVVRLKLNLMGKKNIILDFLGSHIGSCFLNDSNIVAFKSI
jgi:hypothetical protein